MSKITQMKKCPNCKAENSVEMTIDKDKIMNSLKNPLKARKKIKKAKNNPVKSNIISIEPCRKCGAIPESKKDSGCVEESTDSSKAIPESKKDPEDDEE